MSSLLKREVADITTCSICLEDYKGPRALPCKDTFCLSCLQGHCRGKLPGSMAQCPLCRVEFAIPQNGLGGLKVNSAIQKMIETKHATRPDTCVVCSTAQQFVPATVICVDCSQKLCERCSLPHKKMSGGSHDVRQLGAKQKGLEESWTAIVKDVQKPSTKGIHSLILLPKNYQYMVQNRCFISRK